MGYSRGEAAKRRSASTISFLLDTDTRVFWLRGRTTLRDHIRRVVEEPSTGAPAISVVSLGELRYGADYSDRPAHDHQAIDGFVRGLTFLTEGQEAASIFGQVGPICEGRDC